MITDELKQLFNMSWEDLCDNVHDAKSAEGAGINNQGRCAQIAYLMDMPEEQVQEFANKLGYLLEERD